MKKLFLSAVIFLSCISSSYSIDFFNKTEFSKKYSSVVVELHSGAKAEIRGELEVKITMPNGKELTAFLDNAYKDYLNSPKDIEIIIQNYASSLNLSDDLENNKFGKEYIFPVIKDNVYIQQIEDMFKDSGKKGLVYEKLNDVLYVVYAFDTPKAIRFMTEEDLLETGVKRDELRELAKGNLKKSIPNIHLEGDTSRLSMLVADGMYEASFLLFDGVWTKEQIPVNGDIVVYAPTRGLLLITGSEDEESLAKIHSIVYNPENNWSHIVAEVGFIRVGNTWKVYKP
ncbi:DUF1444 family protein [Shewanella sp. 3B26]|uniref:DUF1444 family protein n=1 Tax=Shewanella zhuhaiensis TaxID=2919576 RepID=A0AAJ1BKQ9_9GAMM|nr:DUF1444 family protein [Shewanella zhuhaiensis]MCH4296695.1 DUF1444 family protein [Shewanella zhuhaiensis]